MSRRSLRFRLTALSAGVAAVVLAATAAVLLAQLRGGLIAAVDSAAQARAHEVAGLAGAGRLGELSSLPGPPEVVVQVIDHAGRVVAASDNAAGTRRLFGFPPGAGTRTVRQVDLRRDTVDYRVAAVRAGDLAVYAGSPVDDVQDGVAVLTTRLLIGGPLLLLLLVAGVWLLTGRTLRPVEALRRQAEAIPATRLSQRVAVPKAAELAKLATTLNDLLGRVELAVGQQRQFIDDAAHELRNPVAALLALLEVQERTSSDPEAAELAQQARRLADLVADLLALARLEAGGVLRPSPVDLAHLVRAELVGRPGVHAELTSAWVLADPGLLGRALGNLLDNAARHAARCVLVQVSVDGSDALLVVSDDGPGVPAADRERIFTRFSRLDAARSRDSGGVGLGLAIVAAAVAAAGGSVRVAESAGGARFVVRLPRLERGP